MKRTYQPSTISRKRKHGFLNRNSRPKGKLLLQRRQRKNRHLLVK